MTKQHYLINDETMYLLSVNNKGMFESRVGEMYGESITCTHSPNKIIEINCRHHSQSYTARKELSKIMTKTKSKLPVIIDLFGSHIFFCTHSDRIIENSWFNIKHIHSYWSSTGKTRVRFDNNEEMDVNISFNSFNNQYLNALKLHYRFSLQKEKAHKKEISSMYQHTNLNRYYFDRDKEIVGESMNPMYMNSFSSMREFDRL